MTDLLSINLISHNMFLHLILFRTTYFSSLLFHCSNFSRCVAAIKFKINYFSLLAFDVTNIGWWDMHIKAFCILFSFYTTSWLFWIWCCTVYHCCVTVIISLPIHKRLLVWIVKIQLLSWSNHIHNPVPPPHRGVITTQVSGLVVAILYILLY